MNLRSLFILGILSSLCVSAIAQTTPRRAYFSTLVSGPVTEPTTFILVDLDDTTTFPHPSGATTIVKPHEFILNVSATSDWEICIGPVVASITNAGTAAVAIKTSVGSGKTNLAFPIDRTLRMNYDTIASSSGMANVRVDPMGDNVEQIWGCNLFYLGYDHGSLVDAVGTTTKSASGGDWVVRLIEKVSGTVDVNLTTIYSTE